MASIRPTDIAHKNYSKCRLAKSDRKRIYNRYDAHKRRDSRRILLAGSFDRWRKLRSSLKLRDSSLAWHLMDAHDKGYCTYCRKSNFHFSSEGDNQRRKCDQKEFLPSLLESVKQLCHKHFDFNECIEIIGLLCLEFDKTRTEHFNLVECIRSTSFYSSKDSQKQSACNTQPDTCPLKSNDHLSNVLRLDLLTHEPQVVFRKTPDCSVGTKRGSVGTANVDILEKLKQKLMSAGQENVYYLNNASTKEKLTLSSKQNPPASPLSTNMKEVCSHVNNFHNHLLAQTCSTETDDTQVTNQDTVDIKDSMNSSMCSESEPSLEIDIEKMDTSQEEDINQTSEAKHFLSQNTKSGACQESSTESLPSVSKDFQNKHILNGELQQCNKEIIVSSTKVKHESIDQSDVNDTKLENLDLPLDMSVLKPLVKRELYTSAASYSSQDTSIQNYRGNEGSLLEQAQFSTSAGKRKISETNVSSQNLRKSPFWLEGFHSLPGKMKEDGHTSIPWQRRDMSRKEEYEFLEMNPFSDLADFSQRYPHVHQRTYYRWKRRIKEEYIILEQCPSMSFQEFSSVVLQAKESVFCHWKSLISQGKGFFAPSDTSKRLEIKSPLKPTLYQNSAYSFMQKNLTFTYEQFCQQYPGTPIDIFNVLKRRAMQEFWLFHQNQHMNHSDFSKLVNINEDIFNTWKKLLEYFTSNTLSPNLKSVSNSISPNSHMSVASFNSLDGSSSHASSDLQSAKDGHFSLKDGHAAIGDSKTTTQTSVLNSALCDSAARNLSNSYLASLQNMMFPWHSYYGMTSSIGQQMIPMMLWPGMLGLTGGITSPLGLISGTQLDVPPQQSSHAALHKSLLGSASESADSIKSEESRSNHSDEHLQSNKTSGSEDQFVNKIYSESEKRLKFSHDKEDFDLLTSVSRSRKQNKQEYIYYLKNPELCFKELESLFPSISLRTFYRWRKEINAAVLLLEDNKNMTFSQFQMVFPDIPEDIYHLWKERIDKGNLSPNAERQTHQLKEASEDINYLNQKFSVINQKLKEQTNEKNKTVVTGAQFELSSAVSTNQCTDKKPHVRKNVKHDFYFLQKNPNIDFVSFSKVFPDTSVNNFITWKKECKDAVELLKASPEMLYDTYKMVHTTVTEEVFNVWKSLALKDHVIKEEVIEEKTVSEERDKNINLINTKCTGPEYLFLQLNPLIEFFQFARTYPDVSKHTFHHWKQEIQKIMSLIQAEPSINFADISSVLPHVSEDAFNIWKNIATASQNLVETKNIINSTDTNTMVDDSETDNLKSQMAEALIYLMHNPTVKYNHFKTQFNFVSAATFELWLQRIKTVILYIASNPSIEFTTFTNSFKDVTQDIFELWKNLSPVILSQLDIDCTKDLKTNAEAESTSIQNTGKECEVQEAFKCLQKNCKLTYSVLNKSYPAISETLFSGWISRIHEEVEYIRENPDLQFHDFSKVYPDTKESIFDLWKSELGTKSQLNTQKLSFNALREVISAEKLTENLKSHQFNDHFKGSKALNSIKYQKDGKEKPLQLDSNDDYIKDNVNENLGKESSLSKLTKFADAGSHVDSGSLPYTKKCFTRKLSPAFDQILKNNNKALKSKPLLSSDVDNFVDEPDTISSNAVLNLHSKMSDESEIEAGEMCSTNPQTDSLNTSSITALITLARSDHAHIKASSLQKEQPGHIGSSLCSGKPNWQRVSNGPCAYGSGGITKEEDEAFSSQRQKKMSRAEYLFVKGNPDVDSQEFSRIFPGVSPRTFYRWKKEIKTQLHLS